LAEKGKKSEKKRERLPSIPVASSSEGPKKEKKGRGKTRRLSGCSVILVFGAGKKGKGLREKKGKGKEARPSPEFRWDKAELEGEGEKRGIKGILP